jgi:hypothetical protein
VISTVGQRRCRCTEARSGNRLRALERGRRTHEVRPCGQHQLLGDDRAHVVLQPCRIAGEADNAEPDPLIADPHLLTAHLDDRHAAQRKLVRIAQRLLAIGEDHLSIFARRLADHRLARDRIGYQPRAPQLLGKLGHVLGQRVAAGCWT